MRKNHYLLYEILIVLAHVGVRFQMSAHPSVYMKVLANGLLIMAILLFLVMINDTIGPKARKAETSGKFMMKAVYMHLQQHYPMVDTKTATQTVAMLLDMIQENNEKVIQNLLNEAYELSQVKPEKELDLRNFGEDVVIEAISQYTVQFNQADKLRAYSLAGDMIDTLQKGIFSPKLYNR